MAQTRHDLKLNLSLLGSQHAKPNQATEHVMRCSDFCMMMLVRACGCLHPSTRSSWCLLHVIRSCMPSRMHRMLQRVLWFAALLASSSRYLSVLARQSSTLFRWWLRSLWSVAIGSSVSVQALLQLTVALRVNRCFG